MVGAVLFSLLCSGPKIISNRSLTITGMVSGTFSDSWKEMHYRITNQLIGVIIITIVDFFDALPLGLIKDLTILVLHPER